MPHAQRTLSYSCCLLWASNMCGCPCILLRRAAAFGCRLLCFVLPDLRIEGGTVTPMQLLSASGQHQWMPSALSLQMLSDMLDRCAAYVQHHWLSSSARPADGMSYKL